MTGRQKTGLAAEEGTRKKVISRCVSGQLNKQSEPGCAFSLREVKTIDERRGHNTERPGDYFWSVLYMAGL